MVVAPNNLARSSRASSSTASLSTDDWEARVGTQFRAARIGAGLDQSALAALAGTSLGAVKNLENGRGSTLKTIVHIARALGLTGWLESIAPPITVSPIALLRSGTPARSRVYGPRSTAAASVGTPGSIPDAEAN